VASELEVPVLRGEGCVLRPWSMDDVPLVMEAGQDSYIPLITTTPTDGSEASCRAFVERQWSRGRDGVGYSFAIAADDARSQAVGQVGLWPVSPDPERASTGYFVVERHRGAGFAGRALATLATWAFDAIDMVRLELYVEPWNVGSIRTAERAGFVREGLLRKARRVGGERRDMFVYSRLRDEVWSGAG
jgi:ribosomal-protein-alanine N-acetyltransferase